LKDNEIKCLLGELQYTAKDMGSLQIFSTAVNMTLNSL